jgi:hypothetical protein
VYPTKKNSNIAGLKNASEHLTTLLGSIADIEENRSETTQETKFKSIFELRVHSINT